MFQSSGKNNGPYQSIDGVPQVDQQSIQIVSAIATETGKKSLAYGRAKFDELKAVYENGDFSWRVAGFVAGLVMMSDSALSFLSHVFGLSPFTAILDVYIFFFGLLAACLEYKERLMTQKWLALIRREALFLSRPYGRAIFYFFCGVLMVSKGGLITFICGLFVSFVGAVVYISSKRAYAALSEMQTQSLTDADIELQFKMHDKNGDGKLDVQELGSLCRALNRPLNRNELESALFELDADGSGYIEINELKEWWKQRV